MPSKWKNLSFFYFYFLNWFKKSSIDKRLIKRMFHGNLCCVLFEFFLVDKEKNFDKNDTYHKILFKAEKM